MYDATTEQTGADAIETIADQEAAKLLEDFWTAVEKALSARKGRFVSIAGAGGGCQAETGSAAAMAAASSGVGVGFRRSSATSRAMLSGIGSPGLGS